VGQVKKFLIGFGILAVVCAVHIFLLFKKGYHAPPEKIMTPTTFSRAEDIGTALARRYWYELHNEKVVVLGLSPLLQTGGDIFRGFLHGTVSGGAQFDRFFVLNSLPNLETQGLPTSEPFSWTKVEEAIAAGQRVLIFQLSSDDAMKELVAKIGKGLMLFEAPLLVSEGSELHLQPPCGEKDPEKWFASEELSCHVLEVSRRYYRKKLASGKLIGALEKSGSLKQILYVHEPETATHEF
jgi:hypothetical protein